MWFSYQTVHVVTNSYMPWICDRYIVGDTTSKCMAPLYSIQHYSNNFTKPWSMKLDPFSPTTTVTHFLINGQV